MARDSEDIARADEINARIGCLKGLLNLLLDTGKCRNGLDWLLIDAINKVDEIKALVDNKELADRGQIARIS